VCLLPLCPRGNVRVRVEGAGERHLGIGSSFLDATITVEEMEYSRGVAGRIAVEAGVLHPRALVRRVIHTAETSPSGGAECRSGAARDFSDRMFPDRAIMRKKIASPG